MKKNNYSAVFIVAIIAFFILGGTYLSQRGSNDRTIQSMGNAEMTVMPDEAVVYLNVQTKGATATEAKNKNTDMMSAVLKNLDKADVPREDIQTENFNIYEDFDWKDGEQKSKGFIATNSIKISTEDFDMVGTIIDAGADEGALINYINFELSKKQENEYKAMVLAEASKDAKVKAEAIVDGLNMKLGKLVAVASSDFGYTPYPLYRASGVAVSEDFAMAKQASTDISPKTLDITASVTVTYQIK